MAQKAIIHTPTRVIRRVTIEDNPPIDIDESIVELTKPIDLAGGFWKLDAQNKKVAATPQEIDDADVDEVRISAKRQAKRQVLDATIDDIIATPTLAKVKAYFQALKDLK